MPERNRWRGWGQIPHSTPAAKACRPATAEPVHDKGPARTKGVGIPKKNTDELRPLGIPVMEQRARQALVKLALEPEWEARFEQTAMVSGQDARPTTR